MLRRMKELPWLLVGIVAVATSSVGLLLSHREKQSDVHDAYSALHSVSELKVRQIAEWRRERLAGGRMLARSPLVASAMSRWADSPSDPAFRADMIDYLASMRTELGYADAVLVTPDESGGVSSIGLPTSLDNEPKRAVAEALGSGDAVMTDLYWCAACGAPRVDVATPVRNSRGVVVAALLLRSDPSRTLLPITGRWPGPLATAEGRIIRRDGTPATLDDPARHRAGATAGIRVPLPDAKAHVARALRGEVERWEGRDGRGVRVLADLQPVPDSPWLLVSKVDLGEVLLESEQRDLQIGLIVALVTLLSAVCLIAMRRSEQRDRYRARYEGEVRKRAVLAHYEAVVRYAPDAVILADGDGHILESNHRAADVYGYREDELRGLPVAVLRAPDVREGWPGRLATLGTDSPEVYETVHCRRDGTTFPVEVSAQVIAIDTRRFVQIIVRDISERRRAQNEQDHLKAQLAQAQRMEAVGRLAGGVAHDFNNLLTVINNYAALAIDALPEDSPIRPNCTDILAAGQRAAALTRQLLAFSRKQILQPEILRLSDVVAGVEPILRRLLGEDLILTTRHAADLSPVMADRGQIEQVIMNLVVNARDAMPDGGRLDIETVNVTLDEDYVAIHAGAVAGPHVVLTVSDTGVGMDAETRAHAFDPFFTTKPVGEGTGLGLATVYGIVRQSGGSVRIYSEVGHGTTVKVYLPVSRQAPEVSPKAPAPEAAGGTERLLVVEDEPAVRELTRRVLARAGYQVATAGDGAEALRACEDISGGPDLVITDVVMPHMSGPELAAQLTGRWPGVKVLYVSGYTRNAIAHHGILDPGVEFLSKPFTNRDLVRKVRDVLDGH